MEQKIKDSIRFNTMAIFLIVILCIGICPITLQNDTYYTIKIGEYITNNGITMKDPFSWHQNLSYTYPHWLYDVMIYNIYRIGGFYGIYVSTIVFASILGMAMYFINKKISKNRIISLFVTLVTLYLMGPFICARAQLVTFILFILTIWAIERFLETAKIRYAICLIIIPILIANLHAATFLFYFVLYLPYLAECGTYIIAYCNVIISNSAIEKIKKKIEKKGETEELLEKLSKEEQRYERLQKAQDNRMENPYKIKITYTKNIKWLLIIFAISTLTGFVTPLGNVPYTYLMKTMQGISTKNISEHLPIVLANNYKATSVFLFYIVMLAFTRIKIRLSDLLMIAGLSLLTIYTRRQASMLYLIGTIIATRMLTQLFINNYGKEGLERFDSFMSQLISIIIVSCAVVVVSTFQLRHKKGESFVNSGTYPVEASKWIKENLDIDQIKLYNEYNFGSYLIFEGIPVFVDSRCDLYLPEFNKDVKVFQDFLDISGVSYRDMESKLKEYGFTHFIVSNGSKFKTYLKDKPTKYKQIYPVGEYNDEHFTIYERIDK